LLKQVSPVVSVDDGMSGAGRGWAAYFEAGLDAIRVIDAVLAASPGESSAEPGRILDLPSGWGRVSRFLVVRFPRAEVTACDLIYDGPRFCAQEFGARPVRSSEDFDDLVLPGPFDLIFVGSLLTHLDQEHLSAILRLFRRSLAPGGTLVVTTLGDSCVERFETTGCPDPLPPARDERRRQEQIAELFTDADAVVALESYRRTGIGFMPYARAIRPDPEETASLEASRYGVCFLSAAYLQAEAERHGLSRVYFREEDWDHDHDVHGFQLSQAPG